MTGGFWGDLAAGVLLGGAVRGSLVLLAGAAASLALRRSSAAIRHMAWTAAIIGALLVAPLTHLLPAWPLAVSGRLAPLAEAVRSADRQAPTLPSVSVPAATRVAPLPSPIPEEARPAEPAPALSLAGWFFLVWLAGATALAVSFLVAAIRLMRVLREATPINNAAIERQARSVARDLDVPRDRFRLRSTARALTPMTWGFWRPVVLLPATCLEWDEERSRPVLVHEIAHVRRGDVLTQALSSLACIVYWFNPLVWWAAREMLIERERACDDRVLRSGSKASAYAQELLEMARGLGARWTAARISPAMARRSQVSERLLAVLDPALPRYGATRLAVAAATLVALVLVVPLAAVVPVPVAMASPEPAGQAAPAPPATPAASAQAPAAVNLEEARRGVTSAQAAMRAAIRRGDAAASAALYTQDAVAVAPGVLPMRGRRAIQDGLQHMLDQGIVDIEVHRAELLVVGDKVFESGRVTFRTSSGTAATLQFMTLWKRENGQWRGFRDYATP
jgi:bla regulator protein BlaR1